MGRLVQAYWDCPYCGTKEIRGDIHNCTSCGRARGDVKFYMKGISEGTSLEADQRQDIEYVDNKESINRNPDWYCSFCNSLNSDDSSYCTTCGATREDSESNYFEQLRKKREMEEAEGNAQRSMTEKPRRARNPLVVFLAIILAIVGLVVFMNGKKTEGDLKITGLSWEREIGVEEEKEFSESGWTLPEGAELTESRNEIHHYDSVLDHYENVQVERSRQVVDHYEKYYTYNDLGNGYYDEVEHERPVYRTEYYTETQSQPVYINVPRYQTKYYYRIRRWVPERSVKSSGDDHEPVWPELILGENEREGERKGVYSFTVTDKKGNQTKYQLGENDWNDLQSDEMIMITSKRNGTESHITDKEGNNIAQIWICQ